MANVKILERKQQTIDEIADKVKGSSSVVLFEYRGLNVSEMMELRRKLREANADLKIYKNTLTKRALDTLKIDLDDELNGPKAIAFGSDEVAAVGILHKYAKDHPMLEIKAGIVNGEVTTLDTLKELATIPSREGLLTMLASGLMGTVRDLSICLDLYSQNLEK